MFWKKKSPEFAPEDVRALVTRALPAIRDSLGEPVYVTDEEVPSLVTQSQVLRDVEHLLSSASETLDTRHIAEQLRLGRPSIDAVIEEAVKLSNSFFDGVHVLPTKRIDSIAKSLLSKQRVLKLSEICEEYRITVKAATYAVKREAPRLIVQNDYVIPEEVLSRHVERAKSHLDSAEKPTKLSSVEPDEVMLPLVKARLGFPDRQNEFLPPKFVAEKLGRAEELLQKTGYVASSSISIVEDASKFAKRTGSIVLGSGAWVVSREFVAGQQRRVFEELNEHLYFDLRDLPLGPHLSKYIVEESEKNLLRFRSTRRPHYLVKPQLERDLLSRINSRLAGEAIKQANELSLSDVNGASTISDFVNRLKLPSLTEVASVIEEDEQVPSELQLAETLLPQIRRHYLEVSTEELKPRLDKKVEDLESKIRSYLNALTTIPQGSELYNLAWDEWQQYVSEHQFTVPANLGVAEHQFQPPEAVVEKTTQELRARAESRLSATSNSAKYHAHILHLAATIYHSRHFCVDAPGILKIRGKAVPKLIKQFDFPKCFDDMLRQFKTADPELVAQVREAPKA